MNEKDPNYDPFDLPEEYDNLSVDDVADTHHKLVNRLAKPGQDIIKSLTPEKAHLLHMVVGISGEAGELLDSIKKHVIYNQPLDVENLVEEIGDIQFYIQGILNTLNIGPSLTTLHNIIKLEKRYGPTYSDEAAERRADKCQEE